MITLINGYPQGPNGLIVADGAVGFQLNVDATVIAAPYGFVSGSIEVVFQFNAAGQIQPNSGAAAQIYSNAELNPQNSVGLGTYYLVTFYDANGARINKVPMWWQFPESSGATVDISKVTPISTVGGNIIFYPTDFGGTGTVTSVAFVGDGTVLSATPSTPVTTSGDLIATLLTQNANTFLAGPTTGAAAAPTFRAITAADLPSVSVIWSSLQAATGVLTLNNTTFGTNFEQTSAATWEWSNITAATSGANQNSPVLEEAGTYWTGSASAVDLWSLQNVLGSGTNPSSTLTIGHSGSSGILSVSILNGALNINSNNNSGPTNCATAVLVFTNTSGNTPSYILKGADDSLLIRTDSAFITGSPTIAIFKNSNLQFSTPNCGVLTMNQNGSGFGGGANQMNLTMFQTGSTPHGFYIQVDGGQTGQFFSVDDGSITILNNTAISMALTQVSVSGGTVTYSGTTTRGSSNQLAGKTVVITGFTNGGNNVTFLITSSTSTTLVGTTSTQVNETHTAAASLNYSAPNLIMEGAWWNGSATVPDITVIADVIGSGVTPTSVLTISNSGAYSWGGVSVLGILTGQTLIESATHTPSSASDTGTTGQIAWDANYLYVCISTNSWKRVAIAAGF